MGYTRGEYTNNVLTFYDTVLSAPRGTSPWEFFPMQAIEDPGTGFVIYDDFIVNNTTKTTDLWQVIKGTGGTVALGTQSMGWIDIPTAASANDYQCFFTEEPVFYYGLNVPVVWEAYVNVTEANTNKSSWFAGLTSVTTTGFLQNTGVPASSYSGACIYKTTGGMSINAQTSNGSTQNTTSTAITTVVSGQSYIVGMVLLPTAVAVGVSNVLYYVSTVTSNTRSLVASGSLSLTTTSLANMYFGFGVRSGSSSAETLTVDYVQCAQGRYYQ
jgi:hypothetical protein